MISMEINQSNRILISQMYRMELSQLEMKIYKVQSNKMKPYKMNMMKNR